MVSEGSNWISWSKNRGCCQLQGQRAPELSFSAGWASQGDPSPPSCGWKGTASFSGSSPSPTRDASRLWHLTRAYFPFHSLPGPLVCSAWSSPSQSIILSFFLSNFVDPGSPPTWNADEELRGASALLITGMNRWMSIGAAAPQPQMFPWQPKRLSGHASTTLLCWLAIRTGITRFYTWFRVLVASQLTSNASLPPGYPSQSTKEMEKRINPLWGWGFSVILSQTEVWSVSEAKQCC